MHSGIAAGRPLGSARPAPSVVRMLGNETSKGLILLWDNRRTILPELGVLLVFYFLIQFLVGGGRIVQALFAPTLLAFSFYALLYIVTLKMVAGTLEEMNTGTLEQIHLSPLPSWALSLGRLASAAIEAIAVTALVGRRSDLAPRDPLLLSDRGDHSAAAHARRRGRVRPPVGCTRDSR